MKSTEHFSVETESLVLLTLCMTEEKVNNPSTPVLSSRPFSLHLYPSGTGKTLQALLREMPPVK